MITGKFSHKTAIITLIFVILLCLFVFIYIPYKKANDLTSKIIGLKKTQIQHINSKIDLIPKLVNFSKGYIIKNESALKDIIHLNILTQNESTDINSIYDNQLEILKTTNQLIKNSNNTALTNNTKFKTILNEFEQLYTESKTAYQQCCTYSTELIQLTDTQIKRFINKNKINKILCIKKDL